MIYFLIYLFLEVIISVDVASKIGGLMMFTEIMVSALIGMTILFNFRTTLLSNIMELKEGHISANGFYKRNLLSLLGAILLILPGIFTDIIAIIIHIWLLGSFIISRFMPKYQDSQQPYQHKDDDDVIDAEIISDDPPSLR